MRQTSLFLAREGGGSGNVGNLRFDRSHFTGRRRGEYLRFDSSHFAEILAGGHNQLMVHDPLRLAVEQRAAGMDIDGLLVDLRLVPLLGIFLGRVSEVPARG